MSMLKHGALPWVLGVVLILGGTQVRAQSYGPPPGYGGPAGPMAMGPAGYGAPPGAQMGYPLQPVAMYGGGPAPVPLYGQGVSPDEMASPSDMEGDGQGYFDEGYCGPGSGNICFELLGLILPYAEGGLCAPRWFDVRAEAVQFKRDHVARTVDYTGRGIDAIDGVVLSTDLMSYDPSWGFRVVAALQVGPGSNVEFGYVGSANMATSQSVTGDNDLYSVFSDYGRNPLFGFTETDRSYFQSVSASANFNSYELSLRRRWQGRNCRLQGSWLAGVRYFQLVEDFEYRTRSNVPTQNAYLNYDVGTNNSLTGLQIGGDAWVALIPGLSVGAEGKVGIYGNHAHQNTTIFATTIPNGFFETTGADNVAFLAEAIFSAIYRVDCHWTIRGGYNLIYADALALAPENFNSGPPFVDDPTLVGRRVPQFNNNGNIFYYGWTIGAEYMW